MICSLLPVGRGSCLSRRSSMFLTPWLTRQVSQKKRKMKIKPLTTRSRKLSTNSCSVMSMLRLPGASSLKSSKRHCWTASGSSWLMSLTIPLTCSTMETRCSRTTLCTTRTSQCVSTSFLSLKWQRAANCRSASTRCCLTDRPSPHASTSPSRSTHSSHSELHPVLAPSQSTTSMRWRLSGVATEARANLSVPIRPAALAFEQLFGIV